MRNQISCFIFVSAKKLITQTNKNNNMTTYSHKEVVGKGCEIKLNGQFFYCYNQTSLLHFVKCNKKGERLSLKNKNNMMVIANSLTLLFLALIVYISPIARFFDVLPLQLYQIAICLAVSGISVLWIEIWKWNKRKNNTQPNEI